MSIFKSTFVKEIREQLEKRQDSIESRNPQTIHQLTTRNAWVRMTSSVDVDGDKGALAKKYILQGGALENGALKPGGVGNSYEVSPTRGIRPMPGIISVDVKSKTAYGSLREATVSFSCNSIEQLEDLERLYMRPGYTVLLEWGWSPYINNKGNPVYVVDYYDEVIKGGKTMDQIFKDLFDRSKNSNGNYDALFGKVMNYNWTARPDGGYDCQTTLVSIGEVIESLKVNSVPLDVDKIVKDGGILGTKIDSKILKDGYSLNKLNGLLVELDEFAKAKVGTGDNEKRAWAGSFSSGNIKYDLFSMVAAATIQNESNKFDTSVEKTYITLESFANLLNEHVLLRVVNESGSQSQPIAKISTKTSTIIYGEEKDLLCLAHPYQVSVDINTCLISNTVFSKGVKVGDVVGKTQTTSNNNSQPRTFTKFIESAKPIYQELIRISPPATATDKTLKLPNFFIGDKILEAIKPRKGENFNDNIAEFRKAFYAAYNQTSDLSKNAANDAAYLQSLFNLVADDKNKTWLNSSKDPFFSAPEKRDQLKNNLTISDADIIFVDDFRQQKAESQKGGAAVSVVGYLSLIEKFEKNNPNVFKKFHQENEEQLGVIGNIYLSISMLRQLATSNNVGNDKREVQLYSYLKTIMSKVQESIGNLNNFDIHVDPTDGNVGRIIDVSFTEPNNIKTKLRSDIIPGGQESAFLIEVANNRSIVRSYDLQSQIFPNQSSLIAIGAQVKGGGDGAQGTQNYALLSFNNGVTDRNLPAKIDPRTQNKPPDPKEQKDFLQSNLNILDEYIFPRTAQIQLDANRQENTADTSKYKNALRDIISYSLGIDNSSIRTNSIIPIKLSLTLDGIGGIIIGNIFKISETVLPKGYKFDSNSRSKLFQVVTGLGHKIQNNDWTTTIDAYNIILDDTKSGGVTTPTGKNVENSPPVGNRTAPQFTKDGLAYPFKGNFTVTSVLGDSRGARTHEGVDLAIPAGTTIYAVEAGTIEVADSIATDDAGGIEIRMRHSAAGSKLDGKITQYSHLQELKVRQGQVVTKGQPIGISGNTGNSGTGQPYGPHLHFEVREGNGAVLNPSDPDFFPLFG